MFNLKTLRGQGMMASMASILIYIIVSGTGIWGITQLSSNIEHLTNETARKTDFISPLLQTANNIKNDVVQVQQWITDISATRAQDGLNDGIDVATEFAQKFEKDTTLALALADQLELNEVTTILHSMRNDFSPYFETGKKMAKSYIEFGPAQGNKMMSKFDATAERIGNSVDQLMETVVAIDQKETKVLQEASAIAIQDGDFQTYQLIVLAIIGLIILSGITFKTDQVLGIISVIATALNGAKRGDLGLRIWEVKGSGEGAQLQHNFNQLMDVAECYTREVLASMTYVSKGLYYRTIQADGFGGAYFAGAKRINEAVALTAKQNSDFAVVANDFEGNMNSVVQTVTSAATQLQATAQSMKSTANNTSNKSQTVSTAAETASRNVQTVASAAEELSSSITEISSQISRSAEIASQAVVDAERSGENVRGLAESASKIGEVVNLISDIADQTNLLALNATIEAARAGDAGKGFAVVASEVKNLANQTAKATEEISHQVGGVQHATEDAVKAIQNIGTTIGKIDEASTSIASAIEEQGAATQEIARNVEQAAVGTNEVTENIAEVTQGATETEHASSDVLSAADELAKQGDVMANELNSFLVKMRKIIK